MVLCTSQCTCLSLACRHVEIGRYGQKRLLMVLGTDLNTFLSLPFRHAGRGRYGQERLSMVLGASLLFLIYSLQTGWNW